MVHESEDLAKVIKAYLTLLGIHPSDEMLSKLSRDLNGVLKISKAFNDVVSHEEEPAIFFFSKVESDEKK
ncbi:MAG: hypothetical protein QXO01_05355 [Nitrososphaerota archaeon]